MDSVLRSRLQRLQAQFAALDGEPDKAVWLACDLLVAGVETPAVIELASESPTRITAAEASDLLWQVLVELGMKPLTHDEANWFLGRETAQLVLTGAPRAKWEGSIWRVTIEVSTAARDDGVFTALGQFDEDPEPFREYMRAYLRLADEQATP